MYIKTSTDPFEAPLAGPAYSNVTNSRTPRLDNLTLDGVVLCLVQSEEGTLSEWEVSGMGTPLSIPFRLI